MRKFAPLPKSILLVEILGMGLLTLAWLSLNQYVQLPGAHCQPDRGAGDALCRDRADDPRRPRRDVAGGADRGPAVNALS